jgi:phosphatidylinositol-4,5-bisphosphate 3-kinase
VLSKEMEKKEKKVFSFALDSRMEANKFYLEDCKVMNSKKLPLWLAVKSSGIEDDDEDMPSMR